MLCVFRHGHGLEEVVDRMSYILFIVSSVVGKISSGYKYCPIVFDPRQVVIFGIEWSNSSLLVVGWFILWVFLDFVFVGYAGFKTNCPCMLPQYVCFCV